MEHNLIGSQIAKFRRAAGITQEELGKVVGVSTQAVSRWECGGTPDVSLMPAIADRLGVSIDALFGREGGEPADIPDAARKWFASQPRERTMDQLNRLVWAVVQHSVDSVMETDTVPYLNSAFRSGTRELISSNMITEGGSYFGVAAEDLAFSAICTQPKAGYAAFLARPEEYRRFFSILAKPGCLEIMFFALAQKTRYFTAQVLSKQTGLPVQQVEAVLEEMKTIGWAGDISIEALSGPTRAYSFDMDASFVPFLYLAQCLSRQAGFYYINWYASQEPLL